jgi:hypothetical protein
MTYSVGGELNIKSVSKSTATGTTGTEMKERIRANLGGTINIRDVGIKDTKASLHDHRTEQATEEQNCCTNARTSDTKLQKVQMWSLALGRGPKCLSCVLGGSNWRE